MNTAEVRLPGYASAKPALPLVPRGLPRLLSVLRDDQADLREVVSVVHQFPPVVARVIGLANSAWAAPRRPVTSLEEACSAIGLKVVRASCIALAVARVFNAQSCPQFEVKRFWCNALLSAEAATLARPHLAAEYDAGTCSSAGLLHNLGLLWLVHEWPAHASQAFAARRRGEAQSLTAALRLCIGTDHCEMGERLAKAWGLPDELTLAMRHHRAPDYRGPHARLVADVGWAAATAGELLGGSAQRTAEDRPLGPAGVPPDALAEARTKLAAALTTIRELADTLFATNGQ